MIEFLDRLAGPIDTDSVRIYRRRTSVVQLIVMIVLAIICYQFTVIGDTVYADSMRNFIMNPTIFTRLEYLSLLNVVEINGLLEQLNNKTPLWDMSHWLLLIVKALFMAVLISLYALWRSRHCYTMTVLTGVFHCIAYAQLVIGIYMFSLEGLLVITGAYLIWVCIKFIGLLLF